MYNSQMGRLVNRKGLRYGRLLVVADAGVGPHKKHLWSCRCDCGKEVVVASGSLVSGNTTSCGCFHKEVITIHGGWKKSSYNTWRAMLRRCNNPNDKDFPRYGGRGITVCEEWLDYSRFASDMGEPSNGETLDRINNDEGYLKENCRWTTGHVQAVNSRRRQSKTGHRGVAYYPRYKKWMANITHEGRRYYSHMCTSLEEAIRERKILETRHWGRSDEQD